MYASRLPTRRLIDHVRTTTMNSDRAFLADRSIRFGRRLGWYALARALKPRIIIESGVDKGLGACLLAAALRRNARDGDCGHYFGTDINPHAGYLLSGPYAEFGTLLYGDSVATLRTFNSNIDIFINDSDHSPEYEALEYLAIKDKLSEQAIILGDNAHCTDKLLEFSVRECRQFLYFQERPSGHWYPGGGIGISFRAGMRGC